MSALTDRSDRSLRAYPMLTKPPSSQLSEGLSNGCVAVTRWQTAELHRIIPSLVPYHQGKIGHRGSLPPQRMLGDVTGTAK
jgi:hypothetical protein